MLQPRRFDLKNKDIISRFNHNFNVAFIAGYRDRHLNPSGLTFTICPRPGLSSGSGWRSPDLIPLQFIITSAPDSASLMKRTEHKAWKREVLTYSQYFCKKWNNIRAVTILQTQYKKVLYMKQKIKQKMYVSLILKASTNLLKGLYFSLVKCHSPFLQPKNNRN